MWVGWYDQSIATVAQLGAGQVKPEGAHPAAGLPCFNAVFVLGGKCPPIKVDGPPMPLFLLVSVSMRDKVNRSGELIVSASWPTAV